MPSPPIATDEEPNDTFDGCAKVMFWFRAPTSITCVTAVAARKFVYGPAAVAVSVHVPVVLNVTVPPLIVQVPAAAIDGVTPDDEPVTDEIADTVGV